MQTQTSVVALPTLVEEAVVSGAIWTQSSEELNVNLVSFLAGEGVDEHVNSEVEVLIVGVLGEGTILVDGMPQVLRAGDLVIIPKGARRATQSTSPRFAYLTCHRRRSGLWPQGLRQSAARREQQ